MESKEFRRRSGRRNRRPRSQRRKSSSRSRRPRRPRSQRRKSSSRSGRPRRPRSRGRKSSRRSGRPRSRGRKSSSRRSGRSRRPRSRGRKSSSRRSGRPRRPRSRGRRRPSPRLCRRGPRSTSKKNPKGVIKLSQGMSQKFGGVDLEKDCKIKNSLLMGVPLKDEFTEEEISKKVFSNWNGTCFDIDELVEMLLADPQNSDPMVLSDKGIREPIWKNVDQLENIIEFYKIKGDQTAKKMFDKKLQNLLKIAEEYKKPKFIEDVCNNPKILIDVLVTGKRCIGDHPSAQAGTFVNATEALAQLSAKLSRLPEKIQKVFGNLTILNSSLTLQQILATSNSKCIHGVGFDLCNIYFSTLSEISKFNRINIKNHGKSACNLRDLDINGILYYDHSFYMAYPNNESREYSTRFFYCIIWWKDGNMGRFADVHLYKDGLKVIPYNKNENKATLNFINDTVDLIVNDRANIIANRFSI